MTAITLRKIPPDLARRIRRRAEERGISLNRAVLELLQEGAKPARAAEKGSDDLDALFGAWSAKDAAGFQRTLRAQRRIDPEVWA
ncbi:MAG TPA: hypothetical protein VF950_26930 [Planctomycetota bacterium]